MKNKIFSIISVMFLWLSVSMAWAHPAQDLIEKSTLEAFDVLSRDKEKLQNDPAFLKAFVEEKLIPHLDFKSMTALSIGKHWRRATAEQREALIYEFKQIKY